jgi:hypothetical protein
MWQTSIDPQRGALCRDQVMPNPGRFTERHSDMQAHLGRRRG